MGKKLTLNVDGKELTKKDLKERFDKYNAMYFDGKLGKCQFFWMSPYGGIFGKYALWQNKKGFISKIGVGRNVYWTEDTLRELLVHEMIHMYTRTIEGVRFDGVLGHGRRFRSHCKRLKRDYGLIITKHSKNFKLKDKTFKKPQLWEKILFWLIDR